MSIHPTSSARRSDQASLATLVLSTCPRSAAHDIARALVESRVAACVNIIDQVRSVYRWQGAVQTEDEALLVIKTSVTGFDALERALVREHPYDVPEIIEVPVHRGHPAYLAWVAAAVGDALE